MASKIYNSEWWLVLGVAACVDLIQIILDFFVVGLVANRYIDIVMGMALPLYFYTRGVEMDLFVLGTLVATFVGEEIPLLDAAPLWTLDVWAIKKRDQAKKQVVRSEMGNGKSDIIEG